MIERVTGWLAWAGLAVSVGAVVVSALAAYVGLRQAGSAKQQARTAADALTLQRERDRTDQLPPLEARIDDLAANQRLQSMPSALVLTNRGARDLHSVAVEFAQMPYGIAGFWAADELVSRYEIGSLPALGSARIPLAMAPGHPPSMIRTTLRVHAAASDGQWTITVPCEWHQYSAVPQQGSLPSPRIRPDVRRLSNRSSRRLAIAVVAVLAAALLGFLVAKLLAQLL